MKGLLDKEFTFSTTVPDKVKHATTVQNEIWSSDVHDKLLKRRGYLMMLLQPYTLYNTE
jgi:hypothetical protein